MLPDRRFFSRWPNAVIAHLQLRFEGQRELCIRLVDEAESRDLNNRYRSRDSATNVLSFPATISVSLPDEAIPLGDIVMCVPLISAEARCQAKSPENHWAHLLVHGTLHLLGYDHEVPAEATRMEALEVAILSANGVADPYLDRESNE